MRAKARVAWARHSSSLGSGARIVFSFTLPTTEARRPLEVIAVILLDLAWLGRL